MKILDLRDNALFLQNWRERMRFSALMSGIMLTGIIIVLIFTSSYYNETTIYHSQNHRTTFPWLKKVFWDITILQGIILLFFGTLSADRMTIRERSSGTLEFHRSSPTSRFNQYIGLLLGTTSLEWILFLGSMIFSSLLCFFTDISTLDFLKFYSGLILCTIFYHTLAILLAVSTSRKGILSHRRFGAIQLIFVSYILIGLFSHSNLSTFYHLTWLPAYDQLGHNIGYLVDNYWNHGYSYENKLNVLYSLFSFRLPSIVIQIVTQIPILIVFISGILRKISYFDRPVFSKRQSAFLTFITLSLFVSSSYSYMMHGDSYTYYYSQPLYYVIPSFIYIVIGLGIVGSITATPSLLLYNKGLLKMKKLNIPKLKPDEDYSSNVFWIITFCIITICISFILSFSLPTHLYNMQGLCLAVILSYIIFLSGAIEYFKLSRHNKKVALFFTVIIILWVILPIIAEIINAETENPHLYYAIVAPSPFWGMDLLTDILLNRYTPPGVCGVRNNLTANVSAVKILYADLINTLLINYILAGVAHFMAHKQRKTCKETIQ